MKCVKGQTFNLMMLKEWKIRRGKQAVQCIIHIVQCIQTCPERPADFYIQGFYWCHNKNPSISNRAPIFLITIFAHHQQVIKTDFKNLTDIFIKISSQLDVKWHFNEFNVELNIPAGIESILILIVCNCAPDPVILPPSTAGWQRKAKIQQPAGQSLGPRI